MDHIGAPIEWRRAASEYGSKLGENAEANRVVVPIIAIVRLVGPTAARIQLGAIGDQQRHATGQARIEQPNGKPQHLECAGLRSIRSSRQHRGIPRQQHAGIEPELTQGKGEGGAHIAEAAGLHHGSALGCCEQDLEGCCHEPPF